MEIVDKSDCWIIWSLFPGLKTVMLCSVHYLWFVKYVFSAEIWFVKTSTRVVKYKSQVIKLNPDDNIQMLHMEDKSGWLIIPKRYNTSRF